MFFARSQPVAVSNTVSHSAVWEMQSVGQVSRSGRPVAVANKNPRSIDKKIIASRNDIPSFHFWKKDVGKMQKKLSVTGGHLVCEHIPSDGCLCCL